MAKKKRDTYTSKGERKNVCKKITNAMRRDRSLLDTITIKSDAFNKGKKVYLTIPNPNSNETNKPFIRVPAKHVWKKEKYIMKTKDPVSV